MADIQKDTRQRAKALRFAVPFIPTDGFAAALAERRVDIHSVYVSLGASAGLDARLSLRRWDTDQLIEALGGLGDIPAYALANGRWVHPRRYLDRAAVTDICRTLDRLIAETGLRGIVFADLYFLSALSGASPEIAGQLEAVPSVNTMLDTAAKVAAVMAAIEDTVFRRPTRLILDRALNRDLDALAALGREIRHRWPGTDVGLLANEGCLYQCPFKGTHDALIAMAQEAPPGDLLHRLNRDLGCTAHLIRHPEDLLKSPFIRPEDTDAYTGSAQFIKLCGRTLGEAFLIRTLDAYRHRAFAGNLLDIMDTPAALRGRIHIANSRLPDRFLATTATCDKVCTDCNFCRTAFAAVGRIGPESLRPLTEIQIPVVDTAHRTSH